MQFLCPRHGVAPSRWKNYSSLNPETDATATVSQTDGETSGAAEKKKEEISVSASLANSAAQDKRNSQQGSHYNSHTESTDNEHDFTIHSAEEARRAIIWGEILQRKY